MAYKHLAFSNLLLSMIFMAAVLQPVDGQIISTPCTGPMITSFTPCVNFLTNSSSNGTSPTEDCCSALRTMMTNGTSCLCLIVTGGIPFQMPMNPNLAMSLPQACNMPGVPLQCKAPSPPAVVAPGPRGDTGAPSASPTSAPISPARNPKDSTVPPPSPSTSTPPAEEIPSLTPPSPPADSSPPAKYSGSQTPTAPSAAPSLCYGVSLLFLLTAFGAISLGLY
ncbi:non-specific lipid transfer protein GPI-anchored 20-like [Nicotiana tomentosiformis]|uniref:non-specific lipid transfer protein GPI-anchored 20-like n=1 Tax=Nicotiana tomentosiformis TaxID=4098 RepID=UPI00051C7648|nr:sulfated surface glycoprotein 185-like [Nicotiana tomentosiformis]